MISRLVMQSLLEQFREGITGTESVLNLMIKRRMIRRVL